MNNIKKMAPLIILMILSIFVFSTFSDNDGNNSANTVSAQSAASNVNTDQSQLSASADILPDDNSAVKIEKSDFVLQVIDGLSPDSIHDIKDHQYRTISMKHDDIQVTDRNYIINYEGDISDFLTLSDYILNANGYSWIYANDYYTEDSTYYDTYTNEKVIGRMTGTWNPIVSKVKHINYDKSTEIPKSEWYEVFKTVLNKEFHKKYSSADNTLTERINSPIVIRESWSFNYDNKLVEIITADNIIEKPYNEVKQYRSQHECDITPVIPANDIIAAYKISVVLVNGNIVYTDSHIDDLTKADFNFPPKGELFIDAYSSYQYDANGTIVLCPILSSDDYRLREYCFYNSYMFLDIDNDKSGELLIFHDAPSTSWIRDISAYKINDNSLDICALSLEDVYMYR